MTAEASRVFIDTNILLYAFDTFSGEKHKVAKELLRKLWVRVARGVVSVQVLQEFYVNLLRRNIPILDAQKIVQRYLIWDIVENRLPLLESAFVLQRTYKFSFWDSMIVAAAIQGESAFLITEDLQSGQVIEDLTVINPFLVELPF